MKTNFDKAFKLTLKFEGGYKLHQNIGEETKTYAGIYRKAHPDWDGWKYIDQNKTPPQKLVKDFYYNKFWSKYHLDDLPYPLDIVFFDTIVNIGPRNSIKLLQSLLNREFNTKLKVDGILGPKTLNTLKQILSNTKNLTPKQLSILYLREREIYYINLCNKNPSKYKIFLKGWTNRVFNLLKQVV